MCRIDYSVGLYVVSGHSMIWDFAESSILSGSIRPFLASILENEEFRNLLKVAAESASSRVGTITMCV